MSNGRSTSNGSVGGNNTNRIKTITTTTTTSSHQDSQELFSPVNSITTTTTTSSTSSISSATLSAATSPQQQPSLYLRDVSPPRVATSSSGLASTLTGQATTLITPATTITSSAAVASITHVSQRTVEALGDWFLESASVRSLPAVQEQRRRQNYKSSAFINKTMKQSQEERRKIALAEQAKKRYQFTNHARKLALFGSGQPSEDSSYSEADDSQNEDEDDEDDEIDEDEEDEEEAQEQEEDNNNDDDGDERAQDNNNGTMKKKRKKRSNRHVSTSADSGKESEGRSTVETKATAAHKRRLSSGSESELTAGRKIDKAGDVLSPKKPRLQKTPPKGPRRKKKKDRNPFRDQLMIPEAMVDIPSDLNTNYYLVPLPIGHRCFITSADGKTTARLPSGQLLVSAFESCLPAGSSQYRGNRRTDYCILDCVYSPVTRTFWTLDIMCWRGHPVYECETEFRFWWLRGKLAEIESLQSKWTSTQTREWEQEVNKKKQKKTRQLKRRQEKAAVAAAAAAMDVVPEQVPDIAVQEDGDDGDDEAGHGGMDIEAHITRTGDDCSAGSSSFSSRKFWPIVFTPLPYFNASTNLIRLLAESMYQPIPSPSLTASINKDMVSGPLDSVSTTEVAAPVFPSTISVTPPSKWAPATSFSSKLPLASRVATSESVMNGTKDHHQNGNGSKYDAGSISLSTLGTMALSGEIATAASLFPAHDNTQKLRQEQTLVHERAAGLVFFNKKTMYVLGMTPLCGWVTMEQIGDVFFGEEGGIGPVPGTSAVEGREVEMEDALERIRI